MKKLKNIFYSISICLFISGIIIGLLGVILCIRDNNEYQSIQKEFKGPEVIESVFQHENNGQIYVCYNDASYVNVYTRNGDFLWAVSTPYLRNSNFMLTEDKLVIYNKEAYIYNCHTGEFIEKINNKFEQEDKTNDEEEIVPGDLVYNQYEVFEYLGNGEYKTIISRPMWYWIFNPLLDWLVSFIAAISAGFVFIIDRTKEYNKDIKQQEIVDKRVKFIIKYYKISSLIQITYSIIGFVVGIWYKEVIVGLIPICIHFIISNIILSNIQDRINDDHENLILGKDKMNYWKYINIATIILAFISSVVFLII